VVRQIQAEVLVPAEVLDLDSDHLVVQEAGNHQAYPGAGSESWEVDHPVEEKAYRSGDLVVGRHLAEKEGMACHDRPEEVARLAYQMVVEACLIRSGKREKSHDFALPGSPPGNGGGKPPTPAGGCNIGFA